MPIWSEILAELIESRQKGAQSPDFDFDGVRRKYLTKLYEHTRRGVILYASGWLQKQTEPTASMPIVDEDIQAFMEVVHGIEEPELDLILHSPGGSPETAEAIVSYLRSRFNHIRVIIPNLAMSAATMVACAADEIVLGEHSFLGPTDPQFLILTDLGPRWVPAQAVLDQFGQAQKESADPRKLVAWSPMLSQYGPDLLVRCETALNMSRELVKTWLEKYMFKKEPNASKRAEKAQTISNWLADHTEFKSHSRHIPRTNLEEQGLAIVRLEDDQKLQDLSLSVFHATTHTFAGTPAVKIVENHHGRAFIKKMPIPFIPVPVQPAPPK